MSRDIKLITSHLGQELIHWLEQASSVNVIVSFAMKSGILLLLPHLQQALNRGAEVKILVGDYLYVSQAEALEQLTYLDGNIEARLWLSRGISFHPKAYIIEVSSGVGKLVVGSSNLSRSALTSGFEWNLAMNSTFSDETYQLAIEEFSRAFYADNTVPINAETIAEYTQRQQKFVLANPQTARKWTEREEIDLTLPVHTPPLNSTLPEFANESSTSYTYFTPRYAQVDALDALRQTMGEGYDRALVVMATGLGKTYLAAFFAEQFQRVLFVAHREEILRQAMNTFRSVMPDRSVGLYNGSEKTLNAKSTFASIFTLATHRHRSRFRPDEFDLIVIDEFHHAAAPSYQKLLGHFRPRFLLGLTATPDRADQKDIYSLCDGNVAYQIHFIEAIQRGWLSPFQYFGVYDDIDYSRIRWLGTRYDEAELEEMQLHKEHAESIFAAWSRHKQSRTLAFCSSIRQADFLRDFFESQGVSCVSLHSETVAISRVEAVEQLAAGTIDAIFTVDLFNEGVDIPSVDTLLFVRPTESLTVFTQQIGRGLRLYAEKMHCTIIDLIGNYRHADNKLKVFDSSVEAASLSEQRWTMPIVPDSCSINLDVRVIDLLKELNRKRSPRRENLLNAYKNLKRDLGRRPTYLEFHLNSGIDSKVVKQEFKSYVGFLEWAGDLTDEETDVFQKYIGWIEEVERTDMTKSYKMVLLQAMLNRGPLVWTQPITPEQVAPFFHRYLMEKDYRRRIDFSDESSQALWEYKEKAVASLIRRNPMTRWSGSGNWTALKQGHFRILIEGSAEELRYLHQWTQEACEYRLHWHFFNKKRGG
ncbi:DEAD/DEAH box helicase family protein [Alicyclobacillus ferrooxydans]|uniref:DNA helicase n=1 Tax=Alicyclobacillus ferrooxydans TaxID=471514 RepID=A0A0P9EVK8_9BACL|nr:DEAD/DEAH box helicase family protein [Alicyclobacillus ferrooxydans]KPV43025.1 DNA helicase [Alicyclobacillus ferrooxydans]